MADLHGKKADHDLEHVHAMELIRGSIAIKPDAVNNAQTPCLHNALPVIQTVSEITLGIAGAHSVCGEQVGPRVACMAIKPP